VTLERLVEPLLFLSRSYVGGREGHACSIVQSLFDGYLVVEELFNENAQADVIEGLRQQYKKDLAKVVDIVLSHQVRRCEFLNLKEDHVMHFRNAERYSEFFEFSFVNL
jgi:acetyl-CoA carboxylase/biotin carboxylase 1